ALIFVFYREGYVGNTFLLLGGLAILLFVLALLVNQWIIIGILTLIAGFLIYSLRNKRKYILNVGILFVASCIYVLCVYYAYEHKIHYHQQNRIDVILEIIHDPREEGYNLNQSTIAIGSGQLLGKSFLQGTQTKNKIEPEQSSDFIFCTIGEEWGFV